MRLRGFRNAMAAAMSIVSGVTVSSLAAEPSSHPARKADASPVATDALFTAPASSLSEAEVATFQQRLADWAQLAHYRDENAQLAPPASGIHRVVFFGDSITEAWGRAAGTHFFPNQPYVNRGISGQTTAQMLVRFRQDVIDLHPAAVVILAGTNDIAGNTGIATPAMIENNLRSMAELAKANGVRVILASVLPVSDYPWRPGLRPADKVRRLNAWIGQYAATIGAIYLDYYAALANAEGGMDRPFAEDGVHPSAAGYAVMAPLAQRAIDRMLAQ
jgi:lysophospholipase L1-like esterase